MRVASLPLRLLVLVAGLASTAGLMAVAGCDSRASRGGDTPATFPVSVSRTGGIAGVNQTIDIDATGAWRYRDTGRGTSATAGSLTPAERDQLTEVLADPALPSEAAAAAPDGSCADAFQYQLLVGGTSYHFEDCGRLGPRLAQLLDLLRGATPF